MGEFKGRSKFGGKQKSTKRVTHGDLHEIQVIIGYKAQPSVLAADATVGSRERVYKSHPISSRGANQLVVSYYATLYKRSSLSVRISSVLYAPTSVLEAPGHVFSAHGVAR